jgi:hypothetical protein
MRLKAEELLKEQAIKIREGSQLRGSRSLSKAKSRKIAQLIVFLNALYLSGCAAIQEALTVPDYQVGVEVEDELVRNRISELIQSFNVEVGEQLLTFVSDPKRATSPIRLVAGLEEMTGKLGFGAQLFKPERRGVTFRRTATFRIDLDKEYVLQRAPGPEGTIGHDDLRLLIFHEIGHGLGLDHTRDPEDVMYPDLGGAKDFPAFFNSVRNRIRKN